MGTHFLSVDKMNLLLNLLSNFGFPPYKSRNKNTNIFNCYEKLPREPNNITSIFLRASQCSAYRRSDNLNCATALLQKKHATAPRAKWSMSQLVKGVSPGTESQGVTPQQMHMSSERYSRAVVKTQVKCSQWEPAPSVCLHLLCWTRIWCSRATRIYTTIQHFLSCQNSCFAAMFGVGDLHYRYLDTKKKEDKHGEECWFFSSLQAMLNSSAAWKRTDILPACWSIHWQ